MLPAHSLFVNENGKEVSHVGSAINFKVNAVVWTDSEQVSDSLYRQLVYKVCRSPKRLMFHLQRIYHCFENKLSEQLYAALIDLFYILNGKGSAFSLRIATEVMTVLAEQEAAKIEAYLATYEETLLIGNQYSIFTTGLTSSLALIKEAAKVNSEYDVLSLAHDYIEYSQLEQAMEVLEGGILEMPERLELQIELLELYTITKSYLAYKKMTNQL
ncbi:hypothetical protein [uncultured Gammaproteobacteria bacterium]|jgi:hypothetical protein|nr:hypothetical protein [uncultured Gammaproteobacteria bacterium]